MIPESDAGIQRLFRRNQFSVSDIKYITHSDKKTRYHLIDGREVTTTFPLKKAAAQLPEGKFWSIQKGIIVAVQYISSIDNNGIYTMNDGRKFKGRGRNPVEHKNRRMILEAATAAPFPEYKDVKAELLNECTLMDHAPIAFCIIELIFSEQGQGFDFMFRYCNREMELLFGIPVPNMIDHSFYSVFPEIDLKWIVTYADVALNGTRTVSKVYCPEIKKNLTVHCFQPKYGYCACLLQDGVSELQQGH